MFEIIIIFLLVSLNLWISKRLKDMLKKPWRLSLPIKKHYLNKPTVFRCLRNIIKLLRFLNPFLNKILIILMLSKVCHKLNRKLPRRWVECLMRRDRKELCQTHRYKQLSKILWYRLLYPKCRLILRMFRSIFWIKL